ncbi:MAG: hypothetical protein PUA47_08175 [Bacteroidales bacterium]|nr:hypothetical protein [Bacteroidales bacterium]
MKCVCGASYEAPVTCKTRLCSEGCFCASVPAGPVELKAEVDDYITIDEMKITFE